MKFLNHLDLIPLNFVWPTASRSETRTSESVTKTGEYLVHYHRISYRIPEKTLNKRSYSEIYERYLITSYPKYFNKHLLQAKAKAKKNNNWSH